MNTHWNYRIMARQINEQDIEYAIYEVYYKDDVPYSCSTNSIRPHMFHDESGDPVESIKWHFDAMLKASEKPVLDYDNFPNVYQKYYRKMKLKQIIKSNLKL